ncbi:MAG: hypothetical protein ABIH45_01670 [Candidatus Omnitrophota bacterium]
MSKNHDARKNVKKKPAKTLKERQLEKRDKKQQKGHDWSGNVSQA